jgi:acetolactate synthase-1/3 small subunit
MITTIAAWVENKTGVLARVAGLFTARGLNIESLNVAPTVDPTLSQLTIVLNEPEDVIEQVVKLLNRVIEVVKVADVTRQPHIERELVLIVVHLPEMGRARLLEQLRQHGAAVVDIHEDQAVLEVTGTQHQIESLIALLGKENISELVRTGRVVLPRTNTAKRRGVIKKSAQRPAPPAVLEEQPEITAETPA